MIVAYVVILLSVLPLAIHRFITGGAVDKALAAVIMIGIAAYTVT
jgi:hypothetical protein